MFWTILNFGKHKGKTIPQILFQDPDWFFWACKNEVFKNKGAVQREADDILKKCQSIKIPDNESKKFVIEYCFNHRNGRFCSFEKVPHTRRQHEGSSLTIRRNVIDFAIPYDSKSYDKLGYRLFIPRIKHILFGNRSHRMTKERCDDFFSNEANFKY